MSKITVNYKVEGEDWTKAVTKAFEKVSKKVKIDGFREGKAPRNIFEKKYGKENLYVEASDDLIHHRFHEILDERKIVPLVEPKVDLVKVDETGLEVNYTFVIDPEVKLGKYKGLKVKKDEIKVSKEEIEHEMEHILDRYAEIISKEGSVENGDTAVIDFEGFKDGIAFDGGKGENYSLEIGSGTFIPGFEEQVIGMKAKDTKDIEVTFPKDYASEELKGQKAVFKVTVHDVKTRKIPELNKEFFEDLDMEGITNKKEFEDTLKEEIEARKEHQTENKFIDDLLKAAVKNMEIELDEEIVDTEVDRMYKNFVQKMSMQGLTEEIFFAYANTTEEAVRKEMVEEATFRIKARYLLEAIAKEEKLMPTDEEVNREATRLADKYDMKEEDFLKEFGGLDMVKYDLQMQRAIELMKENN